MLYGTLEREVQLSCRIRSHPRTGEVVELRTCMQLPTMNVVRKEGSLRDSSEEGSIEKQAQARA